MNKYQEAAVKRIKYLAENLHTAKNADKYEIKEFAIDENEYFVSVCVTVGMKNDEGTMAEYICRDHAQLFIGKRGGITYPVSKFLKNGSFKSYEKHFHGFSLYEAILDQR